MFIRVQDASRDYAGASRKQAARDARPALHSVSVSAARGQMLALVGASGSGKTTLLRCIAGLEVPDTGEIEIGGRIVFSRERRIEVPTHERGLAMIFQGYALWPHLSVMDNVAYPLKRRKVAAPQIRERVMRYLDLVGCAALAERFPHQLSGGQQQRVALARALVYEPAVVLFDEPLSNLDAALRTHLRSQIRELQREVGFTGVYVTHDQQEAFYVGDEVAILSQGELVQSGSPDEIYRRPASAGIARFIGAENQASGWLREGGRSFECDALGRVPIGAPPGVASDAPGVIAVRPESVVLEPADGISPVARVIDRIALGCNFEYALQLPDGTRWRALLPAERSPFARGDAVRVRVDPATMMLFPGSGEAAA
jgi:ABC-type Fe3+/spermidine/putrescine transport system ATPase subunit